MNLMDSTTCTPCIERDFRLEIARGKIPGLSFAVFSGIDRALGATATTISPSGAIYPFLAAATTLSVASTSVNDTYPEGTGARQITIPGLNTNYEPISETVNLNGTTPVTTTQSFLRVQPFPQVVSAGSLKSNAGTISISSGASILGRIDIGESIGKHTVYTVPLGFTAFSTDQIFTCGSGNAVEIKEYADFGGSGIFLNFSNFFLYENALILIPQNFFPLVEKTDIDIRAVRSAGLSAQVTAFYELLLVDNSIYFF